MDAKITDGGSMENMEFKALVVEERNGNFFREIQTKKISDLPGGDLLIKVHYSSLNYKDALSARGNKGVTKKYPHTPGIDAAGTVVSSETGNLNAGDKVIVTGYDLGMNTDGGFGEYIRIPEEWVVPLPENLNMKEAMSIGTAGLTAAMSVLRLSELVQPDDGDILVSGATGGVGSVSISILKKLGYSVTALTGKDTKRAYLSQLGAETVLMRQDFESKEQKPLLKPRYAGGIDTVGGTILENMIKSIRPMGVVTCCGNAASAKLELTVYPFILRGITLIGIDSQNYPIALRSEAWEKLSENWKPELPEETVIEVSLDGLNEKIDAMLSGKLTGRVIVKL